MDAGIATEANLAWLVEQGYRYLVVQRGGARQFDDVRAVAIETAGGETLQIQKEVSEDGQEVRLYCHSQGREAKESAMVTRSGLQVTVDILDRAYETGRKAAQELKASLRVVADAILPAWNYTVLPNSAAQSREVIS